MPNKFFDNVKEKANVAKEKASDAIRNGGEQVADQFGRAKHNIEMWWYRPLWPRDFEGEEYRLPTIINITEDDDRCEQDACSGAVAFRDGTKDKEAYTIISSYADSLGLEFYPTKHDSVYYVDPFKPNRYIDLNNYFICLKDAKVNELNEIAQALGATYIKITLKAEQKSLVTKKKKGDAKAGPLGKVSLEQELKEKSFETLEIASEAKFKGHEAHEPTLKYFANEQSIKSLINMRMNPNNKFLGNTYMIKYSNSSGIGEKDAIKIDTVLKKLKLTGNASLQKQIEDENRYYFEYKIVFPDDEDK